jgi:hypothetical protein
MFQNMPPKPPPPRLRTTFAFPNPPLPPHNNLILIGLVAAAYAAQKIEDSRTINDYDYKAIKTLLSEQKYNT